MIVTGTPGGVGAAHPPVFMDDGDLIEVDQTYGALSNPVVAEVLT